MPTPIRVHVLKNLLHGNKHFDTLIEGFSCGFKLGIEGFPIPRVSRNHISVFKNPKTVTDKIDSELLLGRVEGPFDNPPFSTYISSPLGLIPKKEPGEFRLIHDLSFPKASSVNTCIPREASTVQYESLDYFLQLVKSNGRKCLIAKADIESAFRIIPIHPSQHYLLGFTWQGKYYFDKCLPMGCSSSCNIFEKFSSAIQWILTTKLGVQSMSHILDDFMFIGHKDTSECLKSLNTFLALAEKLGIPVKESKTVLPSTRVTVHGILIDTNVMEVSIPKDKLSNMLSLLALFKIRKKCTLKELQSLIGHLNFACLIIVPGRPFLRRLIDLTKGTYKPYNFIRITKEARADMAAWHYFLEHFNGKCIMLEDKWMSSDKIKLYTDAASTQGYAAVFGSRWFNGPWPERWDQYHITIKELYPIVAAVEVWGNKLKNHCILFMSDNMGVVEIINKLTSRDTTIMILVRRLVVTTMKHNIMFRAKHIPGKYNIIADRLSRFKLQEARDAAPWLDKVPIALDTPILPWN